MEPPSPSLGDGEDEEHEGGDFTKIAAWALSEAVIKSVPPWAETTELPMLSRGDGEDEKNGEEEDGQSDEEAETTCSFSLCCNNSFSTWNRFEQNLHMYVRKGEEEEKEVEDDLEESFEFEVVV